jgi:spore coat polysaccharide biosynthesis predicted glycosyltransferase SpsG
MRRRIAILTEGGRGIGFGHVARCGALCEALRAAGAQPRLVVDGDRSAAGVAHARVEFLAWRSRPPRLRALLKDCAAAVVDSYLAGPAFYRWLAASVPLAVYLDDNKRLAYPPGFVVNGGIHARALRYPRPRGRRLLIGPHHILLRRAFWRPPAPPRSGPVQRVLVTAGGSSDPGFLARVAEATLLAFPAARVRTVAARADLPSLRRLGDRLDILLQPADMPRAMRGTDLCVSAGGQTLNELAAFGIPCVGIELADNQRRHLRAWARRGFALSAGRRDAPGFEARLRAALSRAASPARRRAMSRAGRRLVDGRGALRTAEAVLAEVSRILKRGTP